jgi:hypothetical protein
VIYSSREVNLLVDHPQQFLRIHSKMVEFSMVQSLFFHYKWVFFFSLINSLAEHIIMWLLLQNLYCHFIFHHYNLTKSLPLVPVCIVVHDLKIHKYYSFHNRNFLCQIAMVFWLVHHMHPSLLYHTIPSH